MNMSTGFKFALGSMLITFAACDKTPDGAAEAVAPRCGTLLCGGTMGNSNAVGGHATSNVGTEFGMWAENIHGDFKLTGAKLFHDGALRVITRYAVSTYGVLVLYYEKTVDNQPVEVKVTGQDVFGATLGFVYDSTTKGELSGDLKIVDVDCGTGYYMPTAIFCRYTMATNMHPGDTDAYPEVTSFSGYYYTCPDDDNNGTLSADEKHSLMLMNNASLDLNAPSLAETEERVVFACVNGAAGHIPFYTETFVDTSLDPNERALDPSQPTALLKAFMAWHEGESTTVSGLEVCFDDPINGLLDGDDCPAAMQFEAAYSADGAECANGGGPGGLGVHRNYSAPEENLDGWDELPDCTPANYYAGSGGPTIGVFTYAQ